ncbi:hypothetical protein DRO33_01010 [Candidatus Bathyarchaeota archaeon]|nr:MAG: hypothetical protein DRO33_01010 [Candidatus Bathyarchaeota archaeon]
MQLITVQVVWNDGTPVANAEVQVAYAGITLTNSTDEEGVAQFWVRTDTTVTVVAGYAGSRTTLTIPPPVPTTLVVELQKPQPPYYLYALAAIAVAVPVGFVVHTWHKRRKLRKALARQ